MHIESLPIFVPPHSDHDEPARGEPLGALSAASARVNGTQFVLEEPVEAAGATVASALGSGPPLTEASRSMSAAADKASCERGFAWGGQLLAGGIAAYATKNPDVTSIASSLGSGAGGFLGWLLCPSDRSDPPRPPDPADAGRPDVSQSSSDPDAGRGEEVGVSGRGSTEDPPTSSSREDEGADMTSHEPASSTSSSTESSGSDSTSSTDSSSGTDSVDGGSSSGDDMPADDGTGYVPTDPRAPYADGAEARLAQLTARLPAQSAREFDPAAVLPGEGTVGVFSVRG